MSELIDFAKYMSYVGQVQRVGKNAYGDDAVTSSTTTACAVYVQRTDEVYGAQREEAVTEHFALLPSSLTFAVNDRLVTVVASGGTMILSSSTIVEREDYAYWRQGLQFSRCKLQIV